MTNTLGSGGAGGAGGMDSGIGPVLTIPEGVVDSCDVRDIGAVGDGQQLDTAAIQAAIDHCNLAIVSAGTYLIGPLFMRSGVTLELDAGATLVATTDLGEFTAAAPRNAGSAPSIINATGLQNLTITGQGVIDGSGASWWATFQAAEAAGATEPWRPHLIYFKNTTDILIENVTLQNSPKFHILVESSSNLTVRGLTINAPSNSPNTDGIDPKSTSHVRISNCNVSVGDDNVAITSAGAPHPTAHDIIVEDCTFGSGHGVSIGSYTSGGVADMTVQRCTFTGTQNGIRIKTARDRGAEITGILYDSLEMTRVSNAIYFTNYYPDIPKPGTDIEHTISQLTPDVHDITISNVTATAGRRAGVLLGLPESMVRNLTLDNVNITATTGLEVRNASGITFTGSSITATGGGDAVILDENAVVDGL